MEGLTRRHANWDFAESMLAGVLPGSTAFHPNRLVGIPEDNWERFDVEKRESEEIEEDFLSRCTDLVGPLVVVNGTSFDTDQGPYFLDSYRLPEFVRKFDVNVRDYFMNGNVFVISTATGIAIVVLDDGYIARAQGRPVLRYANADWSPPRSVDSL